MIRRILPGPFGCCAVAAVLAVAVAASAPVAAEPERGDPMLPVPKERVEQATQHLLRALELMLMAIPRYAPPEVLENGDIIIRRLPPAGKDAPPPAPEGEAPERTDI